MYVYQYVYLEYVQGAICVRGPVLIIRSQLNGEIKMVEINFIAPLSVQNFCVG